jgi:hypothetical protein
MSPPETDEHNESLNPQGFYRGHPRIQPQRFYYSVWGLARIHSVVVL